MPDLSTDLHTWMLKSARESGQIDRLGLYGLVWGDPQKEDTEHNRRVRQIRDRFLLPYVHPDLTAVEIGPGGGRWTRYLLACGTLYCVDYHQELLDELAAGFRAPYLKLIRNAGADFPGIPDDSVDFVFSYGVFVHLELDIIERYLEAMKRIVRSAGTIVLHYSDITKELGRSTPAFSRNEPATMRALIQRCGYVVREEDVDTLPHSAIVRISPGEAGSGGGCPIGDPRAAVANRLASCLCQVFPGLTNAAARSAGAATLADWNGAHAQRLRSALQDEFGVALAWDLVWSLGSFDDMLDVVIRCTAKNF